MNESQYNPNRLTTPAAVKLELISEIQASLNAIKSNFSSRDISLKMEKIELKHPQWIPRTE